MLLLVVGLVSAFSGCDFLDGLIEDEVEKWEWEPILYKAGQTFVYEMESDDGDGEVMVGETEITITDIGNNEVEIAVSGEFNGESFNISGTADQDEIPGELFNLVYSHANDYDDAFQVLSLLTWQPALFEGFFLEEDDEFFIGFNETRGYYDNGTLLGTITTNIPGTDTYVGMEGFIVDVIFKDADGEETDNWNFCISFGDPIFLMGSAEMIEDDNKTVLLELVSYSD